MVSGRDTGERREPVRHYPNDIYVRRTSDEGPRYVVDVPLRFPAHGSDLNLSAEPRFDDIADAEMWVDVWTVTEGFSITLGSGVPPRVVAESTRVVVAYLTTQGLSTEQVMRIFNLKRATVHSFTSRVRADAEDIREEIEKEVEDT